MLFLYPAVFHSEGGSFWVDFPDLPGCQTYGQTLTETVGYASEALSGYLLTLFEEELPVPTPSDVKTVSADENGFVSLVSCNLPSVGDATSVKKTLTIPAWLNARAEKCGINFSQTLSDALLAKIQN